MKKFITILILSIFCSLALAQQPIFPEAYGASAYIPFENPVVVKVTSLADGSVNDVGTLRWAIQHPDNKPLNRIVVFDVSGVIDLQSQIYASNAPGDEGGYTGSLYIAGQTAPQGGITITGDRIVLYGFDTIIRYVKYRHNGISQDGTLSVTNGDYHITDHCSFSHHSPAKSTTAIGVKQETDSLTATKGTFSNNLMGQNTIGFIAGESDPTSNNVTGQITVIRNAYYNISHRVPLKGGSAIYVDAINNIVHNWSSRTIRMDGYAYNIVHWQNYYQAGGNTSNTLKWTSYLSSSGDPTIFTDNNFLEDDPRGTYSVPVGYDTDESVAWTEFQNNFVPLPSSYFTTTRRNTLGRTYTIYENNQLKDSILPKVGASQYLDDNGYPQFYRDIYDTEFVDGILNNSDSRRDTNLVLPIVTLTNSRPLGFDDDNDGMADAWEIREFGNTDENPADDFDTDGYTNIQEYIDQVDGVAQEIIPVENVELSTNTLSMNVESTHDLDVNFTPNNATDQTGTWTSTNTGIATVDSNGLVTAISEGSCTVFFTSTDGMYTDACSITVIAVPFGITKKLKVILISNQN